MQVVRKMTERDTGVESLWFDCPGCGWPHRIPVVTTQERVANTTWHWNGSLEEPTCTPSLLIKGEGVCHFWPRDGVLDFCADSTHQLAGRQFPLPECKDE